MMKNKYIIKTGFNTSGFAKGIDTSVLIKGLGKTHETLKKFQVKMLDINKRLGTALGVVKTYKLKNINQLNSLKKEEK